MDGKIVPVISDIYEVIEVLKPIVEKYGWKEVEEALFYNDLYNLYIMQNGESFHSLRPDEPTKPVLIKT